MNLKEAFRFQNKLQSLMYEADNILSSPSNITNLFRRMTALRNSEVLLQGGGTGYRFNAEGNQVAYRCDCKRVTTINFDRNKIRKMCADLSRKADETSAALDAALVNTEVGYTPPFDVNLSFADVFELYTEAR